MKRILLDTNIYGIILEKEELETFRELISGSGILIYGIKIIRDELRSAPRTGMNGINLRMDLLRLYEAITRNRELEFGKKETGLADAYYETYKKLGGITSKSKLYKDFLIVAAASLHSLDIVVSEDNATMLNKLALNTYSIVNAVLKLKVPRFINYERFKNEVKK